MVKTFNDRTRLESILIGLCRIRACRGTDPLNNLFISTRSQTGHWIRLFIYIIENVARSGHLLNAPNPPDGRLPADIEVT